jgi:hypothetical protein
MATDSQTELEEPLAAYVSYQSIDAGVAEMVYVTSKNPDYHKRYLSAIAAGIGAAKSQDPELLKLMTSSSVVGYTFEEAQAAISGRRKPTN